jgi:hypothetical protein
LFLYLALQNAHDPNQAEARFEALYPHVEFEPRQIYLAMASAVDEVCVKNGRPFFLGLSHFKPSKICQDRIGTETYRQGKAQQGTGAAFFSHAHRSLRTSQLRSRHRSSGKEKKTRFLRHFVLKTIHLPRQARDKHRESTQKRKLRFCRDECLLVFSSGKGTRLLRHLNIKRSFYQDRLGTNIGKAQKETTRFLIDNGAPGSGSNFPLRGYKLSNFEGGTRVAAFVSGGLLPVAVRGKVADGLAGIYDWSATFFALAVRKRSIIVFHFPYYK